MNISFCSLQIPHEDRLRKLQRYARRLTPGSATKHRPVIRYRKTFLVLLLLAFAVATTATAHAQLDLIDRGGAEPFNQEMVSYRVGIYFQLRGEHERAIAEFTVTIDGLPHFGEAYAARGDSYTVLGEYEQAITDYNQAIRIYPDYVSALYMRGRALAAIGETDLAMADYANVIHQMPEYANAYWGLGDLYYAAGEYANALENYQIYLIMADDLNAQVTARVELLQTAA